jgi:excisionase family DNA binding protein
MFSARQQRMPVDKRAGPLHSVGRFSLVPSTMPPFRSNSRVAGEPNATPVRDALLLALVEPRHLLRLCPNIQLPSCSQFVNRGNVMGETMELFDTKSERARILTLENVAQYLRVHPSTIYRLLKKKQLPAFKVGRDWRFNLESIDRWRADAERSRGPAIAAAEDRKQEAMP